MNRTDLSLAILLIGLFAADNLMAPFVGSTVFAITLVLMPLLLLLRFALGPHKGVTKALQRTGLTLLVCLFSASFYYGGMSYQKRKATTIIAAVEKEHKLSGRYPSSLKALLENEEIPTHIWSKKVYSYRYPKAAKAPKLYLRSYLWYVYDFEKKQWELND